MLYSIKIFLKWHKLAWNISRLIPWKICFHKVMYYYGILDTILIFLGLKNLCLSDISLLEQISERQLIKIIDGA